MRNFFISFLVVFLSLQSSWAVSAAYSGHTDTVVIAHADGSHVSASNTHSCHHDHDNTHQSSAADTTSTLSINIDSDCGVCHITCCSVMITAVIEISKTPIINHHVAQHLLLNLTDFVNTIDRPVWLALI